MNTDASGLIFIQDQEDPSGPMLTVQPDTGGKQQIGWGHQVLPGEDFSQGISRLIADALLIRDVGHCDDAIERLGWTLTQNQWNALSDFTYECGVEALELLAGHGQSQVTTQLPRWVHARVDGVEVVLSDMVQRRAAEVALFNS